MTVKGSGSDLKTIEPKHFPSLDLEDVLVLFDRDAMSDDEMVEYLAQCMLDPKSPRPSIETLLHAFLPFHSVVHSHADAIVSLTNTRNNEELLKESIWREGGHRGVHSARIRPIQAGGAAGA